MPPTTYVPTRSNRAHAAAKDFRKALGAAVSEGIAASGLSRDDLQVTVGGNPGSLASLDQAGELTLEHAMLVATSLDDAGFTAFRNSLRSAVDELAPEGWNAPA